MVHSEHLSLQVVDKSGHFGDVLGREGTWKYPDPTVLTGSSPVFLGTGSLLKNPYFQILHRHKMWRDILLPVGRCWRVIEVEGARQGGRQLGEIWSSVPENISSYTYCFNEARWLDIFWLQFRYRARVASISHWHNTTIFLIPWVRVLPSKLSVCAPLKFLLLRRIVGEKSDLLNDTIRAQSEPERGEMLCNEYGISGWMDLVGLGWNWISEWEKVWSSHINTWE